MIISCRCGTARAGDHPRRRGRRDVRLRVSRCGGMRGVTVRIGGRSADKSCRIDVESVSWTGSDWERLARAVQAHQTPCGEYWISIPPLAADKKGLRVLQDDVIRALGVHPVAEFTVGEATGWANWSSPARPTTARGSPRASSSGAEWRPPAITGPTRRGCSTSSTARRCATRRESPPTSRGRPFPARRDGRAPPGAVLRRRRDGAAAWARRDRRSLQAPLNTPLGHYEPAQGRCEAVVRRQRVLGSAISPVVRWLGVEAYPDVRNWGVPGSSRGERRRHLEEYLFSSPPAVRDAPKSVVAARDLFERAYLPLVNGGYRAKGGEKFAFVTGHGQTMVDAATMQSFVSEQVHAVRHYAAAHTQGSPGGRIGFSVAAVQPDRRRPSAGRLRGRHGPELRR